MSFGDLIDSIGDGLEDVAHGAEHLAGKAIDDGAHAVASGLNTLGLHGAANAVDNFGDSVADHLGDQIPEKQLADTTDPTQLVHGDVDAIGQTVSQLLNFSRAFGDTADGLAGVDTSHWQGQAADTFRSSYQQHPKQWSDARDACKAAGVALQSYSSTVGWAQEQAQQAIDLYQKGIKATGAAVVAQAQAVEKYNDAANAYSSTAAFEEEPGPPPRPPAPFVDPGAADCQRAQAMPTAARKQRDIVGGQAQQAIAKAMATAPATPSFSHRMLDDAQDALTTGAVEGLHLAGGVAKGVGDLGKFVRGINPLDPYNETHPADYLDHMSQTAAGLIHTALHPQELVTGLVGTGWGTDPAEAFGKMIPNLASMVGTDGASAAAEAGEAGADAAKVASTADRAAADARPALSTDADAVHPTVDPTPPTEPVEVGPGEGWGDFGPTGNPDLEADSAAAGGLDTAGGGLGNAERDLAGVHVHAETTTTSAAEGTAPSIGHVSPPPRLPDTPAGGVSGIQSRLGGLDDPPSLGEADASAAQQIDDAGGGLGKLEQDEAEVHVHEPEGPDHNNPDYDDREYRAGKHAQNAYRRKYPLSSYDRRIVAYARGRLAKLGDYLIDPNDPLTDEEIDALRRLTRMDYADINEALRTGDQAALAGLDPEIRNMVSTLNKLKPIASDTTVVRGIQIDSGPELKEMINRYTNGQFENYTGDDPVTISEPAFTHGDLVTPNKGNVQFVITGGAGVDVGFLRDPSVGQQEVIYPPGAEFEVKSVEENELTGQLKIVLVGK